SRRWYAASLTSNSECRCVPVANGPGSASGLLEAPGTIGNGGNCGNPGRPSFGTSLSYTDQPREPIGAPRRGVEMREDVRQGRRSAEPPQMLAKLGDDLRCRMFVELAADHVIDDRQIEQIGRAHV